MNTSISGGILPSTRRGSGRRGLGLPVIVAFSLPFLIMIAALAVSFRSSAARRVTSSFFMNYLALELAESAVAEAAHNLQLADIFDETKFGDTQDPLFSAKLLQQMVHHPAQPGEPLYQAGIPKLPGDLTFEYRDIFLDTVPPQRAHQMLTAMRFPADYWNKVETPGVVREIALENSGVLVDDPLDLVVYVRPLAFRREFYRDPPNYPDSDPQWSPNRSYFEKTWVNWGVLQFKVQVRVQDLKGTSTLVLKVDRRFSLTFAHRPGDEKVKVSSFNLRAFVTDDINDDTETGLSGTGATAGVPTP